MWNSGRNTEQVAESVWLLHGHWIWPDAMFGAEVSEFWDSRFLFALLPESGCVLGSNLGECLKMMRLRRTALCPEQVWENPQFRSVDCQTVRPFPWSHLESKWKQAMVMVHGNVFGRCGARWWETSTRHWCRRVGKRWVEGAHVVVWFVYTVDTESIQIVQCRSCKAESLPRSSWKAHLCLYHFPALISLMQAVQHRTIVNDQQAEGMWHSFLILSRGFRCFSKLSARFRIGTKWKKGETDDHSGISHQKWANVYQLACCVAWQPHIITF